MHRLSLPSVPRGRARSTLLRRSETRSAMLRRRPDRRARRSALALALLLRLRIRRRGNAHAESSLAWESRSVSSDIASEAHVGRRSSAS